MYNSTSPRSYRSFKSLVSYHDSHTSYKPSKPLTQRVANHSTAFADIIAMMTLRCNNIISQMNASTYARVTLRLLWSFHRSRQPRQPSQTSSFLLSAFVGRLFLSIWGKESLCSSQQCQDCIYSLDRVQDQQLCLD